MRTIPFVIVALSWIGTGAVSAQDFRGQIIVAGVKPGNWHPRWYIPGGLWLAHPRNPAPPVQMMDVQGQPLPLEITGNVGAFAYDVGSASILVLPDGDLLVGEATPPAGSLPGVDGDVEVHRMRLAYSPAVGGWTAAIIGSYVVAIATAGSVGVEVADLDLLPNGNVLLLLGNSSPTVTPGSSLMELNLNTGQVSPWTIGGSPSRVMALGVDQANIYLGGFGVSNLGIVLSAPIPNGSSILVTVLTLSTTIGPVLSMDLDNQGQLVVGTWGSGTLAAAPSLHRVDPVTGAVMNLLSAGGGWRNTVLVERNTDWHPSDSICWAGGRLEIVQAGTATTLVPLGTEPWGIAAGLAMVPAIDSYGSQSTCVTTGSYAWQTAPNPGALSLVGNTSFSITMQTPSPQPACMFALGFGQPPTPIGLPFCAQLLLIPSTSVIVGAPNPTTTFTLPLLIPNLQALAGTRVFAQTFHLVGQNPDVIESSPGLGVTIL